MTWRLESCAGNSKIISGTVTIACISEFGEAMFVRAIGVIDHKLLCKGGLASPVLLSVHVCDTKASQALGTCHFLGCINANLSLTATAYKKSLSELSNAQDVPRS